MFTMIPKIKTWKVSFAMRDGTTRFTTVQAPTKLLARMSADRWLGGPSLHSKKITATVICRRGSIIL